MAPASPILDSLSQNRMSNRCFDRLSSEHPHDTWPPELLEAHRGSRGVPRKSKQNRSANASKRKGFARLHPNLPNIDFAFGRENFLDNIKVACRNSTRRDDHIHT